MVIFLVQGEVGSLLMKSDGHNRDLLVLLRVADLPFTRLTGLVTFTPRGGRFALGWLWYTHRAYSSG